MAAYSQWLPSRQHDGKRKELNQCTHEIWQIGIHAWSNFWFPGPAPCLAQGHPPSWLFFSPFPGALMKDTPIFPPQLFSAQSSPCYEEILHSLNYILPIKGKPVSVNCSFLFSEQSFPPVGNILFLAPHPFSSVSTPLPCSNPLPPPPYSQTLSSLT